MLFAFVVLISQVLENDIFSIEMNLCMQFCSSKGLETNIHFKYFTKTNFYILFCDKVPLINI